LNDQIVQLTKEKAFGDGSLTTLQGSYQEIKKQLEEVLQQNELGKKAKDQDSLLIEQLQTQLKNVMQNMKEKETNLEEVTLQLERERKLVRFWEILLEITMQRKLRFYWRSMSTL
jgi:hypothetical protein